MFVLVTWFSFILAAQSESTDLPAPNNFQLLRISPDAVEAWWDPLDDHHRVTGYCVHYSLDSNSNTDNWQTAETENRMVNLTGLIPHSTYAVRVKAKAEDGRSGSLSDIVFSPDKIHERNCPDGFQEIPRVGCYHVTRKRLSRDQSAAECETINIRAHLISVESAAEQQAIQHLLNALPNSVLDGVCKRHEIWSGFWTSGTRALPTSRSSPFEWKNWKTGGDYTRFQYSNWFPGEPNYHDEVENCVNIMSYRPYYYGWNDNSCEDPMCAICEVELINSSPSSSSRPTLTKHQEQIIQRDSRVMRRRVKRPNRAFHGV